MPTEAVPDIVVGRLPLYLRALEHLLAEGREITSSQELGERLSVSAAQIRKDLSFFGEFGKQGTGYRIAYLAQELRRILKVDREWPVALVGAGALGHALANYAGFRRKGFYITAIYDNDPEKIGTEIGGLTVRDANGMHGEIASQGIKVAIIAAPAESGQKIADALVDAGVKAILNYAPISITVPQDVRVQYVDPAAQLQRLTYYL